MATLAEIRQKHPEYADLSDQQLAEGLHKKFYSDMPFDDFAKKVQYKAANDPLEKLQNPEPPPASFMNRLGALGAGFNTGVAYLAGLPVDTLANVRDLGKAAIGGTRSLFTDSAPPDWLTIKDRARDFGSGENIRQAMNKIPGEPAQIPRPDDKASRYIGALGSALPAAASMRPTTAIDALRASTQTAAPMLASQAAGEAFPDNPAAMLGAAMATQFGGAKIGDWAANRRQALPPVQPQPQAAAGAGGTASATSGGSASGANLSGSINVSVKSPGSTNGYVGPDESANLTAMQRDVMRRGMDMGMRMTPGQATGSRALQQFEAKLESQPMTSGPFNAIKENNQRVLARATAKAIGENDTAVDAGTLDRAFTRIGRVFDDVKDDVPRQIDPQEFLTRYSAINDDMRGVVKGFGDNELVSDFIKMAEKGSATGKELQNLTSKLGKAAKNQMTTASGDRELGMGLYQVKDYVDDLIQQGMSGDRAARFADARREYRNLMTITSRVGVVDPSTGNVSGRNLANTLQQRDKLGFLRDKNRSDMYDAARFAKAFGPVVGDSGTATRSPIQGVGDMVMRIPYNLAARAYTAPSTVNAAVQAAAMSRSAGNAAAPVAGAFYGPWDPRSQMLPYLNSGLLGNPDR